MTVITGTEYKANQGKYIQRAREGERVIISSHGGYVELKPIPKKDKDVKAHIEAKSFLAIGSYSRGKKKNMLRFNTIEELRAHLASL